MTLVLVPWLWCAPLARAEAPAAASGLVDDVIRQVARERGAAAPAPATPPATTPTAAQQAPTPPSEAPATRPVTTAAQEAGPPAPSVPLAGERATGATLCVHDPQGLAADPILVDVEGFTGPMRPLDDGVLPDVRARDGVHSVTLSGWGGGPVKVRVRSGARAWDEEARVANNNQLWVSLTMMPGSGPLPDGSTVAPPGGDPNAPKHVPDARPDASSATAPTPGGRCDSSGEAYLATFHASFFAWMTAGAGLFVGLGIALGRAERLVRTTVRAETRPARLDGLPALHAWTQGNGPRRWVVVGPVPEGLTAAWSAPSGVLPEEVYDRTAALALAGGDPVAVLVTDGMGFDAPDERQPEDVLADLLAGRCPLLLLAGAAGPAGSESSSEGSGTR